MVVSGQKYSTTILIHYYWLLIVALATALSDAQSTQRQWKLGFTGKAKWSESCNFKGGDYDRISDNSQTGKCEELCVADKRCTHFTANPRFGCFLKRFEQQHFVQEETPFWFLDLFAICGFAIDRGYDVLSLAENTTSLEWRIGTGNGNYKLATGCKFIPGLVIDNVEMGDGANCGDFCFANKRCNHFNYFENRCYLKRILGPNLEPSFYNDPDAICGFVVERKLAKNWESSNNGRINWGVKCDFSGGIDLGMTKMSSSENKLKCGEKCLANKRCTHFVYLMSWLLQNECFLKEFRGGKGAVEIYKEDTPICGFIVRTEDNSTSAKNNELAMYTKPNIQAAAASLLLSSEQGNRNLKLSPNTKKNQQILLWSDEFSVEFSQNKNWKHVIGVSKTGFNYYTSHNENSFTQNGMLHIKPTLTSDRFGDDFLEKGYLDLIEEGCDPKSSKCIAYGKQSGDIINPVASAEITTKDSFNFTIGTVEIRAKMPKGDWISTGIFLVPAGNVNVKGSPSGRIELLRVHGNLHMSCLGRLTNRQVVSSGLLWGHIDSVENDTHDAYSTFYQLDEGLDYSTDFHVFSTSWSPEGVKFFVDGKLVKQVQAPKGGHWTLGMDDETNTHNDHKISGSKMAPFNQPFFISVRVDVGGQNFPDTNCTYLPKRKPWSSSNPAPMREFWDGIDHWLPTWKAAKGENTLQIDYIRIYNLPE